MKKISRSDAHAYLFEAVTHSAPNNKTVNNAAFLQRFEAPVPKEIWSLWASQHAHVTKAQLNLLANTKQRVRASKQSDTTNAIQNIIFSEIGLTSTPPQTRSKYGPKNSWRIKLFNRLGLDNNEIRNTPPLPQTELYTDYINALNDNRTEFDQLVAIEAMLALQLMEFRNIQKGLDASEELKKIFDLSTANGKENGRYIHRGINEILYKHGPEYSTSFSMEYTAPILERFTDIWSLQMIDRYRNKFDEFYAQHIKYLDALEQEAQNLIEPSQS